LETVQLGIEAAMPHQALMAALLAVTITDWPWDTKGWSRE
jgi:hypothetical protein